MLVLTQLSVGAFIASFAIEPMTSAAAEPLMWPLHALCALVFGLLAIAASVFHLGRPRFAFRAVLGLAHSWLSREIVAFGIFAVTAIAYAGVTLAAHCNGSMSIHDSTSQLWIQGLRWAVAASGAVGVFCSVMIYVFTRRECWSFPRVAIRFALTAALLGVAAIWFSILIATILRPTPAVMAIAADNGPMLCRALMILTVVKLTYEAAIFRHLVPGRMTPLRRSARLLAGELSSFVLARFALGALGGVVMPLLLWRSLPEFSTTNMVQFATAAGVLFVACVAGELLERYLFFTACAAPRMPGGIR
jgi:DMSO reductase anchor subunit